MFVEGLYEIPEVRSVSPGHLVRCGHSSVYDVNFGKEVGAASVNEIHSIAAVDTVVNPSLAMVSRIINNLAFDLMKRRQLYADQIFFHNLNGIHLNQAGNIDFTVGQHG